MIVVIAIVIAGLVSTLASHEPVSARPSGYSLVRPWLAQPVCSDNEGDVHWLQSERIVAGLSDFFTSGIRSLENPWRRDEAIGAADLGWADVDLLLMPLIYRFGRLARKPYQKARLSPFDRPS